ncbi:MAG: hypothetical protein WA820_27075 [Bradyrhizobium sp.]
MATRSSLVSMADQISMRCIPASTTSKCSFTPFDMLAGEGDDMRQLQLSMRKANLARLLARRTEGIFIAPFEQGEIGPDLFRAACNMGLEGLVSKRQDRPYRGGPCSHWVKVKNRNSPAMKRAAEVDWSR